MSDGSGGQHLTGPHLTVGVIAHGRRDADLLFNQCDGQGGRHRGLVLRPMDARAERLLVFAPPIGPDSRPKPRGAVRRWAARRRGVWDAVWAGHAWDVLGRPAEAITALVFEPPDFGHSDAWWAVTRARAGRVFGTDPRATERVRLPAMWSYEIGVDMLRGDPAPTGWGDRPMPLAAITSGIARLAGHHERLGFLRRLRAAGVPLELFGRGLPAELGPRGPVASKASVLRAARFALVIENSTAGDLYASEKIWDALLSWCVPIYLGSGAVDRMIPAESFIRLPDLGEAGLDVVRAALADEAGWSRRLGAVAEARRLALGELRLVEWLDAVLRGAPWHPALDPGAPLYADRAR